MRALRTLLRKIDHYRYATIASHPGQPDNGPFPLMFLTPGRHH